MKKICSSSSYFSLLQTTKLDLKWPTTLQQPGTNFLAPTMWTLAGVKRDLDGFLDQKWLQLLGYQTESVQEREEKNAEFRLRQNPSMREADFNQSIRQRNQLVVAGDNFLREQKLSPVLQTTLSKDMEEQLKLVHKVIDVVDCPNKRICVTLLRYEVDNPETSYA